MTVIALLMFTAALIGGAAGGFGTRWWLARKNRQPEAVKTLPAPDPAVDLEIERVAGAWAEAEGHPEAKLLMAEKLAAVYGIGKNRGWWS